MTSDKDRTRLALPLCYSSARPKKKFCWPWRPDTAGLPTTLVVSYNYSSRIIFVLFGESLPACTAAHKHTQKYTFRELHQAFLNKMPNS